MSGATTRGRVLLLALGMGLALGACGAESKTPALADQQARQDALTDLLGSPAGAAAYEALARGLAGAGTGSTTGLWVSGQGKASGVPDLAVLNLGIEAFAGTVAEARSDGASAMALVLQALKSKGVSDADIQTRHFNISARYTSQEVTRCVSTGEPGKLMEDTAVLPLGTPETAAAERGLPSRAATGEECVVEREQVVLGYEVTNQLTVKIRDLESAGAIIDAVTEAGGDLTRFQGVAFTIEDASALEDEARAAAVGDLMAKAQRVASLAGVELAGLTYFTESGGVTPSAPMMFAERALFADSAAATSIMAGELEVTVFVQGAFSIQQPGS